MVAATAPNNGSVVADTDQLLTPAQVMAMLQVSRKGLYDLRFHENERLRLKAYRIGERALRFKRAEVMAWLESNAVEVEYVDR